MSLNTSGPQSSSSSTAGHAPRPERADAARNRRRILETAARLFDEHDDPAAVSLDTVAAAAGVGKGTLFRRFGDKSGLAAALLDDRERELQEAILHGPPPLGPGAEPQERAAAFVVAYLRYALTNLDLVRMSETASPGARYRIGAYRFWRQHLDVLLREAGCRPTPAGILAHALLAPLAADHLQAQLDDGATAETLNEALSDYAAAAFTR
ncbi:MAG: helix-turn-helix transcriptional regulator [Pseudonocardiales bacterium]|nr:helix-turn-helix transcriptional regulator [Pseudonocardiales bacterium]MBV9030797.1 helix-turn-helix transcriptional regulator [Pseudonocardiales bacterium]MBW0008971.1 helix-turn-helix transcriptional regulator [Pseudonocardiales bacterium]